MHNLQVIKTVCSEALEDDDPAAMALFRDRVDPGSVLEMVEIIETLLAHVVEAGTSEELVMQVRKALHGQER
jgi:hypothetical protein